MEQAEERRAQETQTTQVSVQGMPGYADASPTLTLIFATLCFCFWANTMGLLGEGATLALGVLQIAVFVGYTVGGVLLLARGNGVGGNVFMVFGAFFGAAGGFTHVAMTIAAELGVPFDYQVLGIVSIVGGAFLLACLPGMLTAAKTDFFSFLTGGLGVLFYGLTGAELLPAGWNYFAAWCLFVDGLIGFYAVTATMLGCTGINLSCGKPFVPPKNQV